MLALVAAVMAVIAAWMTAGVLLFFVGCVVDYYHGELKETVGDLVLFAWMCAVIGPLTIIPMMIYLGEEKWLGHYSQIVYMYGCRAQLWCEKKIGKYTRKLLEMRIQ